jgi:LPS-assembly protein
VTLAALSAAGFLAWLCAAAPVSPPASSSSRAELAAPTDVRIEGDVTYQPGTGRLLVENGAVLRRGAVTIRARSATFDPATGEVRAAGGALLTDPTRVVSADAIRAVLGGEWEAEGVVAFVKDAPVDLSGAATVEEARCAGRNRLSFSGARLQGEAEGDFTLDAARITLCDCPGGAAPSWEITARRADVRPGERAILSWPVLRITPPSMSMIFPKSPGAVDRTVPVLALPWLYVPLGDRQTGLLLPEVRSTAATGFAVSQPLFVTLGRSADATLTADFASGRTRSDVAKGEPAVRGPGARLELRWAPAVDADGRVELAWVYDLDDEGAELPADLPRGEHGNRFALTGGHRQRLSDRTTLSAALRLVGDPVWVRDFTSDVLGRTVDYRRSELLVSRRGDDLVLEGGANYLQPLRPGGILRSDGEHYGLFGSALDGASRWPGLSATLVPVAVGPLRLAARTGLARYAPVSGVRDASGGLAPEPRTAATRADAEVELSAPLLLGGIVSLVPYARGATAGYALESGDAPLASVWGVAGASLGTEVSRRYGRLRHAISPRIEWRAGTDVAGDDLPFLAYDARDRTGAGLLASGPPGAWSQLRGGVESRLGAGASDVLRLALWQDYDVSAGRFAETTAAAAVRAGPLGADAHARFLAFDGREEPATTKDASRFLGHFTELRAALSLSDRRGDSLHAGFFSVGAGGSGQLLAGLDPLFDLRAAPVDAGTFATAGARAVAGPATFGYDALLPGSRTIVAACTPGGGERTVSAFQVRQHTASFAWDSPCRCFRLAALVSVDDCGNSSYRAMIDLSRLGEAGAVR